MIDGDISGIRRPLSDFQKLQWSAARVLLSSHDIGSGVTKHLELPAADHDCLIPDRLLSPLAERRRVLDCPSSIFKHILKSSPNPHLHPLLP